MYIYIHILYPFVNRLFQFFAVNMSQLRFRATVQAPSSGESCGAMGQAILMWPEMVRTNHLFKKPV